MSSSVGSVIKISSLMTPAVILPDSVRFFCRSLPSPECIRGILSVFIVLINTYTLRV